MFQMFCFYFHWFSQVLEDGNGAGGANSPREAGSSDELWAQMQVLLIANLKNSLSCDFQNNRQTMQCWRLHEAYNANLKGRAALQQKHLLRICAVREGVKKRIYRNVAASAVFGRFFNGLWVCKNIFDTIPNFVPTLCVMDLLNRSFLWFLKPSNLKPPRLICDTDQCSYINPKPKKQAISDIYRTFTDKYIW